MIIFAYLTSKVSINLEYKKVKTYIFHCHGFSLVHWTKNPSTVD